MATLSTFATVLSGGLAGAALTLGAQSIIRFRNRPRLGICFFADDPGCVVDTPGWLVDANGNRLLNQQGNPRTVQQRYLRLKIPNSGRTFAQNTSIYVTRLSYQGSGAGQLSFSEEVFDLKLALTKDVAIFNLASEAHRFIDLVHTQQEPGQPVHFIFDFINGAARLRLMNLGAGQYEMQVFVTAQNAKSVRGTIRFAWDGTQAGLTIS